MMNKGENDVDFYRAICENPRAGFALFTCFSLVFAASLLTSLFHGVIAYLGYGLVFVAAFVSLPPFFTILVSVNNGGSKIEGKTIDRNGRSDYLAEAEIYIAFGKQKEARSALHAHLNEFPNDEKAIDLLKKLDVRNE